MDKEIKDKVLGYKANPPRIQGSTTINHAIRVKMGLGCMEYTLMEAILDIMEHGERITDTLLYIRTGFTTDEQLMTFDMLIRKGFIFPEARADGIPAISPKWKSFFDDVEKRFEEFWTKDGKTCWPGSKIKAKSLFEKVIKKHSFETLMHQRNAYFKYLDLANKNGFERQKMMATVFLGPQERFNEDWSALADQEAEKWNKKKKAAEQSRVRAVPDFKASVQTKEERMKKYEN